jgi:hypothetical protein
MHGTIDLVRNGNEEAARARACSIPLEQFDPGYPVHYSRGIDQR